MSAAPIDYREPGWLTALDEDQLAGVRELDTDAIAICAAVQGLIIEPNDALAAGVPEGRLSERNIRPARALIELLHTLSSAPIHEPRPPAHRVVGTCRHYAVLACALLRAHSIGARARCGFATYFLSGKSVDHWIVEYRQDDRWIRVDTELLGTRQVDDPADLAVGEFLTGGEAWSLYRADAIDPSTFGVAGVDYAWGIGEIRGNAIRDLASLCKIEMLPWDEWGRMDDSYQGRTGEDYDELMDRIAAACNSEDADIIQNLYASEDLTVPAQMIR